MAYIYETRGWLGCGFFLADISALYGGTIEVYNREV